jgi:hypothetical protein
MGQAILSSLQPRSPSCLPALLGAGPPAVTLLPARPVAWRQRVQRVWGGVRSMWGRE